MENACIVFLLRWKQSSRLNSSAIYLLQEIFVELHFIVARYCLRDGAERFLAFTDSVKSCLEAENSEFFYRLLKNRRNAATSVWISVDDPSNNIVINWSSCSFLFSTYSLSAIACTPMKTISYSWQSGCFPTYEDKMNTQVYPFLSRYSMASMSFGN